MARLPRFDLPGIPQHIVQRGNNRLPCFMDDADRERYLDVLGRALPESGCQLHAYVLMDNHVHLLATPGTPGAVGQLMQQVGRRYVPWFNKRHARTGTLWEGRYKACLVDSDDYLLRCARYIELNPVRARMTDDPAAYRWSSCAAACGLRDDPLLAIHEVQESLGATPLERGRAWRALLSEGTDPDELQAIRDYLAQQRAWGRDDFRARIQHETRRFASVRPAHRPPEGAAK